MNKITSHERKRKRRIRLKRRAQKRIQTFKKHKQTLREELQFIGLLIDSVNVAFPNRLFRVQISTSMPTFQHQERYAYNGRLYFDLYSQKAFEHIRKRVTDFRTLYLDDTDVRVDPSAPYAVGIHVHVHHRTLRALMLDHHKAYKSDLSSEGTLSSLGIIRHVPLEYVEGRDTRRKSEVHTDNVLNYLRCLHHEYLRL